MVSQSSERPRGITSDRSYRIQKSRTNMAILHFVLTTPKWSISLFLFLASQYKTLSTPYESIQLPLLRLQTLVGLEALTYQQCSINAMNEIQEEVNVAAGGERQRVARVLSSNEQSMHQTEDTVQSCVTVAESTQEILALWKGKGMGVTIVQNSSECGVEAKEFIENFLDGDAELVQNEIYSVWDDHMTSVSKSLDLFRSYAVSRINYDINFFVTDRVRPLLEYLGDTPLGLGRVHLSFSDEAIKQKIRDRLSDVADTMQQAHQRISQMNSSIENLSAHLDLYSRAYSEAYDRVVRGADFVRDIIPRGSPLPEFFELETLPLADSLMPSITEIHELQPDLISTSLLIENATIGCFRVLNEVIRDFQQQANQQLRGATNDIFSHVGGFLKLDAYDPPTFHGSHSSIQDFSGEIRHQDELGQIAREASVELLENLKLNRDAELYTPLDDAVSEDDFAGSVERTTTFDYLRLSFPFISIPDFVVEWLSWVVANTWILEVVVQAYRLLRLEAMYTSGAIPDLPEINYDEDDSAECTPSSINFHLISGIFRCLTRPTLLCLSAVLPVYIGVVICWQPHVEGSCQQTTGTFFANHFLSPLLINEASALGNAHFVEAEFQCYQLARAQCNSIGGGAQLQRQSQFDSLEAIQARYNQSVNSVFNSKECIENATIFTIDRTCCGLSGFDACATSSDYSNCPSAGKELHKISWLQADASCSVTDENWQLDEADVDCSAISRACSNIPCQGVNKPFLQSQIIQTDCQVELYIIGLLSFGLLVFYHAVAINVICTLVFSGVRKICWKSLCPSGIPFRTRLQSDGTLVGGRGEGDRRNRARTAIRHFEAMGRWQLMLGGLCGGFWFVSLFLL